MARTKEFNEAEVLNKALVLFWKKGYNGTSAQDLVDELGLNRSSLYNTFGDKYSLFKKALLFYKTKFSGSMIDMVNKSQDPEKTLREVFHFIVSESLQEKMSKGCFMVNSAVELAPHNPEIAAIVNQNMKDIEQALQVMIKKGQEKGSFSKKHSPRALAHFLFNTISGLRVSAKSGVDKKLMDEVVKVSLSALR